MPPWADETLGRGAPAVLRVMRNDFFCMPFGGNETPYRGERHPPHGETANGRWRLEERTESSLHLSLTTTARAGRVDKRITLVDGHAAIYHEHVISGMTGRMPLGHHSILQLPDRPGAGRISTSRIRWGSTRETVLEAPRSGGRSALAADARFSSLRRVRAADGQYVDLSRYPARRGYTDLVMVAAAPARMAWTALTVASARYVWFALRDPEVLASTVMWFSNGGRSYAPWSDRHVNVVGLEDVTAYYDYGVAESARANALSRRGVATRLLMRRNRPFVVRYVTAVAEVPRGFDEVRSIRRARGGVALTAVSGRRVTVPLDVGFIAGR
jgi:hypothetical protein